MDLDIKGVRYFLVLAQERSFRRAAQKLRIPQPHLTRIVQALEQELGTTLLDRSVRPVVLTDAGRVFLDAGKQLVDCAEECGRRVTAFTRPEHRRLNVGFDQYSLAEFASLLSDPSHSPRFIQQSSCADPIEMLQQGSLQIALIGSRTSYGGLSSSLVLTDKYMLASAKERVGKGVGIPVSLDQVSGRLLVTPDSLALDPSLARTSAEHDIAIKVGTFAEALALAAMGVGDAVVPASYQKLQTHGVVFRDIAEPLPPSEVVMCWRDGSVPEELLNGLRTRSAEA